MITFYKYTIYRVYSFFEKKDTTPIGNTVLVMIIVHGFQLLTIDLYLSMIFNLKREYVEKSLWGFLIFILIALVYYFIVFYNGNWRNWIKEFKKESIENRKKNGIKVWLFCWGSIIFFFLSLLFTFNLINYLK